VKDYINGYSWRRGQRDLGMLMLPHPMWLREIPPAPLFHEAVFLRWERGHAHFSLPPGFDWSALEGRELTVCFRQQALPRSPCHFRKTRAGRAELTVFCGLTDILEDMLK
jgi:hypothetical protein